MAIKLNSISWAAPDRPFDEEIFQKISQQKHGLNLYFRKLCIKSQIRFSQLINLDNIPKVFLHGNPHLDNLVAIGRKTGMVDFDRARIGPYAWDIVRFLGAMAMRLKNSKKEVFLPKLLLNAFYEGYHFGFEGRESDFYRIPSLMAIPYKSWQQDLETYLRSGVKWAKKLSKFSIDTKDNKARNLLSQYFKSRFVEWDKQFKLVGVAIAKGSLGNEHYIYHMQAKEKNLSSCLIDIKKAYLDDDSEHFFSHFVHRGIQMIEASKLYAPGLERGLGICSWKGEPYWGRIIAIDKRQFSGKISKEKMLEVALGVGSQLGKAHQRSCYFSDSQVLIKHFENNFSYFVEIAEQLNFEILQAYKHYIQSVHLKAG